MDYDSLISAENKQLKELIEVAKAIVAANPRVLKTPEPVIGVTELADSSITLSTQPWVAVTDYGECQNPGGWS